MVVHRVLDHVFSTWSHIAVLRVLQDAAHGLTGREVARSSSMSHRSCHKALTDLEELHLVVRQRGGRDHLFALNRSHILVSDAVLPILQKERQFPGRIEKYLKEQLQRKAVSVVLFGSVARRQETVHSDLDLCVLVQRASQKEKVQTHVHAVAPHVLQRFGAQLAPIFLTTTEFRRGFRVKKSPMKEIVKDGRLIAGKTLREVLRG